SLTHSTSDDASANPPNRVSLSRSNSCTRATRASSASPSDATPLIRTSPAMSWLSRSPCHPRSTLCLLAPSVIGSPRVEEDAGRYGNLLVGIELAAFVIYMQIIGVEQSRILEALQIWYPEGLVLEPNKFGGTELLQGAIDMDLGKSCGISEIGLSQGKIAA